MNFTNQFLHSAIKQFEYYKMLGDKTFVQLTKEQIFFQPNDNTNSIAIIINHLYGNMLSRWTDFLTSDGEKDWRDRDEEFENKMVNKEALIEKWEAGWTCLFNAIKSLTDEDFEKEIFIRNQGHTVVEAINRQLCHYSYHVGQIVFLSKYLINENWTSLSIPKGNSKNYNAEKFAKEKNSQHFTDEFLKK